jgi:uncharacterized membrane protein
LNKLRYLFISLAVLALASCADKPSYPEATGADGEVRFSISTLAEGKPVFRSLEYEGTKIDYIVLKTDSGVESYLDACAKCYPKKRGYRAEGDDLVCVACGKRYPIKKLTGIGSCYPLPLKGRAEGDSYIIEKKELVKGQRYF